MKRVSLVLIAIAIMLSGFVASVHGQQSRSKSQSEVVAAAFAAEVTGTVKNVNEKSGKLVLDTAEGPVNVKLPAEAVQGIKKGDPVTVSIGLVKPPPSASPQTSPSTK
jgi:ferric-dicitrate binding protein FerR (iron transport regulator)